MGSPTLQTTANPRPEKTRGGRSARIGHMHGPTTKGVPALTSNAGRLDPLCHGSWPAHCGGLARQCLQAPPVRLGPERTQPAAGASPVPLSRRGLRTKILLGNGTLGWKSHQHRACCGDVHLQARSPACSIFGMERCAHTSAVPRRNACLHLTC